MPAIALAVGAADVFAAVAILLLVWAASTLLVKPLAWLLGQLPVIGSQIADALYSGAAGLTSWATGWARWSVDAFVQLITAPVHWLGSVLGQVVWTIEQVGGRLLGLIAYAGNLAGQLVHGFAVFAGEIARVLGQVVALAAAVPGIALRIAQAVAHETEVVIGRTILAIQAAFFAAIAAEHALIVAVHGDLLRLITGQVAVLTAAIGATAATLRREWAADLVPIDAELSKLGDLAKAISTVGVLTLVPALVKELTDLRRGCIDPMCSVTTPQIPTLTILADLATLGIVGGLIGEAVRDPQGAARVTAGAVGGVHTAASDLLGAFAGVKG